MYEDYNDDDLFSALSYSTNTTDFLPYSGAMDADVAANSVPTYQIIPPPTIIVPTSNDVSAAIETLRALKSEVGYSSSSSYGSPSSLPSHTNNFLHNHHYQPSLFQRSMSSHSLLDDHQKDEFFHPIFSSHLELLSPSCHGHGQVFDLDSDDSPMRKVYSTGDLQIINLARSTGRSDSPLSNENCIEGLNKVGRYTAEERKERIERYRSKRNQRNFTKKIKYVCRKTLADSRPRIRGRFARNDETGEETSYNLCLNHDHQWNLQMGVEATYNEEVDDVWINFYEASLLC